MAKRKYEAVVVSCVTGCFLGRVNCFSVDFSKVTDELGFTTFFKKIISEVSPDFSFEIYIITPRSQRIKKHILFSHRVGWCELSFQPGSTLIVNRDFSVKEV